MPYTQLMGFLCILAYIANIRLESADNRRWAIHLISLSYSPVKLVILIALHARTCAGLICCIIRLPQLGHKLYILVPLGMVPEQ